MKQPLDQRTSIREVAKKAGVSISTVSRALNAEKGKMTDETRQRVIAAAKQLNYVPNRLASGLKNDRSQTLGLAIPNILNPFFTAVVRSVQDSVASNGYEILICNTDDNPEREAHAVQALLSRRVDGLIVAKCVEDNSIYKQLAEKRFPLVLVDREIVGLSSDTVVVDNFGVCRDVMGRLLELGHRRIGILTPPAGSIQPRIDRIEGCRSAMRTHGLPLTADHLIEVDFHKDSGAQATARLLSRHPPPTALFVLNTFLAMGALTELESRKLRLPGQLSFVMFDDPEWAKLLTPKISVVQQPVQEIGSIAARLVTERIGRPEKPFENIRLEAKFIERESVQERKC